jgi:hypothetical protein
VGHGGGDGGAGDQFRTNLEGGRTDVGFAKNRGAVGLGGATGEKQQQAESGQESLHPE